MKRGIVCTSNFATLTKCKIGVWIEGSNTRLNLVCLSVKSEINLTYNSVVFLKLNNFSRYCLFYYTPTQWMINPTHLIDFRDLKSNQDFEISYTILICVRSTLQCGWSKQFQIWWSPHCLMLQNSFLKQ